MSYTLAAFKRAEAAFSASAGGTTFVDQATTLINAALFGNDIAGFSADEIWNSRFRIRHSHEYITCLLVQLFFFLFVVDFILLKLLLGIRKDSLQRWYLVHFIGNFTLVAYSLPAYTHFFRNIIENISADPAPFDYEAVSCVAIVHMYHLVAFFKDCSAADWVHHIVFVAGGVSTTFAQPGMQACIYLSHVSGFGGGLDYLNLALVRAGLMAKNTRLRIAVELNMWVRVPGILFSYSVFVLWFVLRKQWTASVTYALVMTTIAAPVNALYYARLVTLSAGATLPEMTLSAQKTATGAAVTPAGGFNSSPPASPSMMPDVEETEKAKRAGNGGGKDLGDFKLPAALKAKERNN